MNREELIEEALHLPPNVLPHYVSRQLATFFPEKVLTQCQSNFFDVEEYTLHEECLIEPRIDIYNEFVTNWEEPFRPHLLLQPIGSLRAYRLYHPLEQLFTGKYVPLRTYYLSDC